VNRRFRLHIKAADLRNTRGGVSALDADRFGTVPWSHLLVIRGHPDAVTGKPQAVPPGQPAREIRQIRISVGS